jgi:DNA-binding FadR family transcriptional regulator
MEEKPLVEIAIDGIMDYISEHDFEARHKLPNEFELAKFLKVGRSTIREAVKALVSRNILEVRQGAGTFIASKRIGVSPDPLGFTFIKDKRKLIEDLMEVRMMIEPRIASLAAAVATPNDVSVMRRLHHEIEAIINANADHTQKDIELHVKIAESSGNIVVPNLLPVIQQAIALFVNATNRILRSETIETHGGIIDAIEAHNPVAASDAMTLHIMYNRMAIRKLFETGKSV